MLARPRALSSILLTATILGLASCAASTGSPTPSPAGSEWSYDGEAGPDHWGEAAPTCTDTDSSTESPIDIVTADMKVDNASPALTFAYHPGAYKLENNGHTIEAVPDHDDNIVTYDGTEYVLQQFHLHAHSEHLIDGVAADAELHLVHKGADGDVLVIGVLLEEGAANSTLDELFDSIPQAGGDETELKAAIDAADLIPTGSPSARYEGSLTTPPCTEGVQWNVFLEPQSISADQLAAFTSVYPDNHRPVQPLHHREVTEVPAD